MKIERPIVRVGNSAGVVLPREWLNGRARIELVEKPLNIRKDVLQIVEPYLEDVIGIYLVGSYARKEQTRESDVDVLVISGKTAKPVVSGKYEIVISPLSSVLSVLKEHPEIIFPKIMDAEVIMNKDLLEELRSIKLSEASFDRYFRDSKKMIVVNKEHIELDKSEGDVLKSDAVIYSVLLRLRAFFMIKCILQKRKYSNKNFQKWIIRKVGIDKGEYEKIYDIYRAVRDDKKTKMKIKIFVAEKLLALLEEEIGKHDRKKKKA